jgi:hypothetical protein
MSKKQPTRTLGSIETNQIKEPKEALLEEDDDDNIELTDLIDKIEEKPKPPKKKRVITEEHKKVILESLARARSVRKQASENKKILQEDFLKQKEGEINETLIKKLASLKRKKETEMMKKFLSQEADEAKLIEPKDELVASEEVIIKKKRAPRKKIVNVETTYQAPPVTSVYFC